MPKQILVLIVLLSILVAGLFAYKHTQKNTKPKLNFASNTSLLSLSSIPLEIRDVQSILVFQGDELLLNAKLEEGKWLAYPEQNTLSFPVDTSSLLRLLSQVQNAKIKERKTNDPSKYFALGLNTLSADSNEELAHRVILKTDRTLELIVGKRASSQQGQYVKFARNPQSYLLDQNLDLPNIAFDWLNKELFKREFENITKITAYKDSELLWSIVRDNDSPNSDIKYSLEGLEENQSLAFDKLLNNYVETVNELSFTDLQSFDSDIQNSMNNILSLEIGMLPFNNDDSEIDDKQASLEPSQTSVISINLYQQNDKYFVSVKADNELNYLNNWLYELPNYTAENLNKTKEDFLLD